VQPERADLVARLVLLVDFQKPPGTFLPGVCSPRGKQLGPVGIGAGPAAFQRAEHVGVIGAGVGAFTPMNVGGLARQGGATPLGRRVEDRVSPTHLSGHGLQHRGRGRVARSARGAARSRATTSGASCRPDPASIQHSNRSW
jgi:hypothetical protein